MPVLLQMLQGLPARAGVRLREATASAALLLAAAMLLLAGAALAVAALYLWLATFWPAYLAALVTAGAPLVIAALLVVRVWTTTRRGTAPPSPQPADADLSRTAEEAGAAAVRETLSEMRANPAGVLAGALVLGIMAGLLSPSSRN